MSIASQQANQTRHDRADAKGRREARFDLRQGTTMTSRDARDMVRQQRPGSTAETYWRAFSDEMRKKGR